MKAILESNQSVLDRARISVRRLTSARQDSGRILLDLPIIYPSGGMVVVEIESSAERFWVSDMGFGATEADLAAAGTFYQHSAQEVSKRLSVDFDGNAIFALWVTDRQLEAAIISVANASAQAAASAVRRASESRAVERNELIFEKISHIFGKNRTSRVAEFRGRHASWEAHNVVHLKSGGRAIFEYMSAHPNSAASKFFMFSDLAASSQQISLNAVVNSIDRLDAKGQLVSEVANIMALDAPESTFEMYARAS